jgi:putative salt-induced outer membrane protein YdiY
MSDTYKRTYNDYKRKDFYTNFLNFVLNVMEENDSIGEEHRKTIKHNFTFKKYKEMFCDIKNIVEMYNTYFSLETFDLLDKNMDELKYTLKEKIGDDFFNFCIEKSML